MTAKERQNWLINIENAAAAAAEEAGGEVVRSVFQRYDAQSLRDLSPRYYSEVFADLEQIQKD